MCECIGPATMRPLGCELPSLWQHLKPPLPPVQLLSLLWSTGLGLRPLQAQHTEGGGGGLARKILFLFCHRQGGWGWRSPGQRLSTGSWLPPNAFTSQRHACVARRPGQRETGCILCVCGLEGHTSEPSGRPRCLLLGDLQQVTSFTSLSSVSSFAKWS